jgi:hypothetical protein
MLSREVHMSELESHFYVTSGLTPCHTFDSLLDHDVIASIRFPSLRDPKVNGPRAIYPRQFRLSNTTLMSTNNKPGLTTNKKLKNYVGLNR